MFKLPILTSRTFSSSQLIVLTAVFITLFANMAFFSNVAQVYPLSLKNGIFLASLGGVSILSQVFLYSLLCHRLTIRPVLVFFLLLSSLTGYFMDQYGVVIDDVMIDNIVKTDPAEVQDLLNMKLASYVLFLGVLPSFVVLSLKLNFDSEKRELISRFKLVFMSFVVLLVTTLPLSAQYASFLREHKPLRYYFNPGYTVYSAAKFIAPTLQNPSLPFKEIGKNAKIPKTDINRELVIMVVGATARADHFSLNGYKRQTNPLLAREKIINFPDFWACDTSTAASLPCMFSKQTRKQFDRRLANSTDNLLDVLSRAGVNVLWRDNNSSSKGVADRVAYESFKSPKTNPVCDIECRDVGMLATLQGYIDKKSNGDIFIVLHQLGNHGPAYYERYPQAFRKFTPTCDTNELSACSSKELINSYDNAILYTDYFLSQVIKLLKQNENSFETVMFYASDHGESLGENGVYLHGLPYFIAPDAQKHVPAVMWFGKSSDSERLKNIETKRLTRLSHDNIFSTVLGLFEINTDVYDSKLDILDPAKEE